MVAYSFKRRFVDPIRVGLSRISLTFDCAPKRQTIRAVGKRRHARPGETVQLYTGMRTRSCQLIGEGRCFAADDIRLFIRADRVELRDKHGGLSDFRTGDQLDRFAVSDGFDDWAQMKAFWLEEHDGRQLGPFRGVLIRWEPL